MARFNRSVLFHRSALLVALALVPALQAEGTVRIATRDAAGAPVADAVVWLTRLDAPVPLPPPPAEPVVIEQKGEEYSPYVTAIIAGTRISFPNRDRIQHHVYSLSKPKRFEIPLHGGEDRPPVLFDQPGVVALGCNIHDWMSAYVVVVATPHFAKTPAAGTVTLAGLPPGRYRLEVWHPRLAGNADREITVTPADPATQTVNITLKADRRIIRAPDADGASYK